MALAAGIGPPLPGVMPTQVGIHVSSCHHKERTRMAPPYTP
jgi:hypothetical protein